MRSRLGNTEPAEPTIESNASSRGSRNDACQQWRSGLDRFFGDDPSGRSCRWHFRSLRFAGCNYEGAFANGGASAPRPTHRHCHGPWRGPLLIQSIQRGQVNARNTLISLQYLEAFLCPSQMTKEARYTNFVEDGKFVVMHELRKRTHFTTRYLGRSDVFSRHTNVNKTSIYKTC
jgi:hypothetical protein